MRIGIVCFPSLGGSGVVATELAVGLASRGHRVHLFSSEAPQRPLPSGVPLRMHVVEAPAYPVLRHPPYALALASRLIDVGREEGLDLVNAHYAVPHAASAFLAASALGPRAPRIVVSLHGTDVSKVGGDPSYRSLTSFVVRAADAITVPSRFLRDQARAELGIEGKVEVVPNFVDVERFRPAGKKDMDLLRDVFPGMEEGEPLLVHVSNFRPIKRTPDLMDLLARVRRRTPARMLLVGDGPERARAEARARELGLSGAVRFLGPTPDLSTIVRQGDLFVVTSETESFCLAALEALASGVPVIGYRVGGLPELVTEEVGRLVAPFSVDELAEAAVQLLESPERVEMARRARARAEERYRPEPALDRYEITFRRALEGPGSGPREGR
jgi:N-acetyl-alpha-D-glucosaminyl L-malate synthase BshA